MKKVLSFILTISLIVSLSACSNAQATINSNGEQLESNSIIPFKELESSEAEIDTTNLFKDFYEEYYYSMDSITFDKLLKRAEKSNYTVEAIPPSEEDLGHIIIKDIGGNYVSLYFYPNSLGDESLTSITYSDGTKEITQSDDFHVGHRTSTYDPDRSEPNQSVSGITAQKEFMFE